MKKEKAVLNEKVPGFKKSATGGTVVGLSDFKGKRLVLFFYPKDDTPGCTREGEGFRDHYKEFKKLNTEIFGVSKDSMDSHEKFKSKFQFPFELISDPDEELSRVFDVIREKDMYGKKYMGIERSTFVIDEKGKLLKEWRKVKVPGHVEEVLEFIKSLK